MELPLGQTELQHDWRALWVVVVRGVVGLALRLLLSKLEMNMSGVGGFSVSRHT